MIYIGLDPSTHFGWAVLDSDGNRIDSGVWEIKGDSWEGAGYRWLRLEKHLRGVVVDAIQLHDEVVVGYEAVKHRHRSSDAARSYFGCIAVITKLLEELKVPYTGINISDIKTQATGKGNASKEEMVAAANKQWSIEVADDNEADALWCASRLRWELT